ncbi:hypothetical protein A9P82_09445 [Arachidicoccus ginsenosidimutans]|nr:hypothetical protein A9P82_09445 [Arachidicoccus sp. BS20]
MSAKDHVTVFIEKHCLYVAHNFLFQYKGAQHQKKRVSRCGKDIYAMRNFFSVRKNRAGFE